MHGLYVTNNKQMMHSMICIVKTRNCTWLFSTNTRKLNALVSVFWSQTARCETNSNNQRRMYKIQIYAKKKECYVRASLHYLYVTFKISAQYCIFQEPCCSNSIPLIKHLFNGIWKKEVGISKKEVLIMHNMLFLYKIFQHLLISICWHNGQKRLITVNVTASSGITLIPNGGPLLETSNLFVSFR